MKYARKYVIRGKARVSSKYLNELHGPLKIANYRGNDLNELPKKLSEISLVLLKILKLHQID